MDILCVVYYITTDKVASFIFMIFSGIFKMSTIIIIKIAG